MAWFAIASLLVWGPVRERAAALVGSARGAESVCIAPRLSPFVVAAALECIPLNILPKKDDTAETLAERLGSSIFLDDAHPLRGGNGKRKRGQPHRIRLNAYTYSAVKGGVGQGHYLEDTRFFERRFCLHAITQSL